MPRTDLPFMHYLQVIVTLVVTCLLLSVLMCVLLGVFFQSLAATLGAMIGTGMLVRALPYEEGIGLKQAAWVLHSAVIGAVIAPLTLLGGPIMIRAACYTAGIVGGNMLLS